MVDSHRKCRKNKTPWKSSDVSSAAEAALEGLAHTRRRAPRCAGRDGESGHGRGSTWNAAHAALAPPRARTLTHLSSPTSTLPPSHEARPPRHCRPSLIGPAPSFIYFFISLFILFFPRARFVPARLLSLSIKRVSLLRWSRSFAAERRSVASRSQLLGALACDLFPVS